MLKSLLYSATLLLIAASVSTASLSVAAAPINVVASTSIIEDLVRNVGGSRVSVSSLVPRDADTHDFQPSTADARNLARARAVFLNGLGLEAWLQGTVENAIPTGAPVVELARGIKALSVGGAPDPHAWWDPRNAAAYLKQIESTLVKLDPAGAASYRKNAAAYAKALTEVDAWAARQFASLPAVRRKLVTNHDTFTYLAARYGLKIVGTVIPGIGTEREPSARDMAALSDVMKREGVKVIFVENTVAPRLAQAIAASTGARLAPPLYTDSLGKPGSTGDSYLKAFRHNVNTIVAALK